MAINIFTPTFEYIGCFKKGEKDLKRNYLTKNLKKDDSGEKLSFLVLKRGRKITRMNTHLVWF